MLSVYSYETIYVYGIMLLIMATEYILVHDYRYIFRLRLCYFAHG